jgi:sugar lactone lactonase YvrE
MTDTVDCELVLDAHAEWVRAPFRTTGGSGCCSWTSCGHIRFDPETRQDRIIEVGRPIGCVALAEKGDWIVAASDGFYRVDPRTGRTSLIAAVEADLPDNRMNDGYVDTRGRLWAGSLGMGGLRERGALSLDPTAACADVTRVVSNGWTGPDGGRSTSPTPRPAADSSI